MRRSRRPAAKRRLAESFLGVDDLVELLFLRQHTVDLSCSRRSRPRCPTAGPSCCRAAAEHGSLDRETVALEHPGASKRAGAVILTYLAAEVAEALGG